MIWLKSKEEIELMRQAGALTVRTLELLKGEIRPGITTNQLNSIAEEFIKSQGAVPSFKNYRGYPKSICASINSVVVHGIPDGTVLREGDIISIDIGVQYKWFHGDAARTFGVGDISDEAKRLIETTKKCFFDAVGLVRDGVRLGDISSEIQAIAEGQGYGVVRELVGHGIGAALHEEPDVPNYGKKGKGIRLSSGMTIAIEPMINAGTHEVVMDDDGWTVRTLDDSLSAHYENTIAVTEKGYEILTLLP